LLDEARLEIVRLKAAVERMVMHKGLSASDSISPDETINYEDLIRENIDQAMLVM
jgi:hypothetical protein